MEAASPTPAHGARSLPIWPADPLPVAPVQEPPRSVRPPIRAPRPRTSLAVIEAMIPGSRRIPRADENTLVRVDELVAEMGSELRIGWGVAMNAIQLASRARTGRGFADLDAAAQEQLLQTLNMDPVMRAPLSVVGILVKLAHFDDERVYKAIGGMPFKRVDRLEQPRWLEQIRSAEEWTEGDEIECEVVVVGTGAGGAVVGKELAQRGYAVVYVEEGHHYRRDAFNGSAVDAHRRFYRNAFTVGNMVMPTVMGRLVGGSTAINTGTSLRTPSFVLDRWCERLGTQDFAPERMEAYFDRVENFLGVQPPERRYIGPIADVFDRGCAKFGWSCRPVPRNAVGCEGGGFCDYGCATDARRSMNLSYIPHALERGALCLTGLRADKLLTEPDGRRRRAVGIEGVTASGRRLRVRARAVVFAGGAIPTPQFLMRQGLCNGSGQLGRNMSLHPSTGVFGVFDERIDGHRHIPQGYLCDQFVPEGILISAAQADANAAAFTYPCFGHRLMDRLDVMAHTAGTSVLIRDDEQVGRIWLDVRGNTLVRYDLTRGDIHKLHQGMLRAAEMHFAAGARRVLLSLQGAPELRSLADLERFSRKPPAAGDIACISYHPLGTCRMGADPRTSVVGLDHQAHEVAGLYLVDGSTVPGPMGVNPQITIMAMASRASEHIAAALG